MKQYPVHDNHPQQNEHKPDEPPDVGACISARNEVGDLGGEKFHAAILIKEKLKERMLFI
jgi:hypothetical protein